MILLRTDMTLPLFFLIIASVMLSALAQITLKHGMSTDAVQAALSVGGGRALWVVGTNLYVLGGLSLYGFGAILWLGVLAKVDVSLAYPFVAFGFILTMCFAILISGETVSGLRIAGTILIAAGAMLVARS